MNKVRLRRIAENTCLLIFALSILFILLNYAGVFGVLFHVPFIGRYGTNLPLEMTTC